MKGLSAPSRVPAMLIDARSIPDRSEIVCDLCVVGAGPAGIAVVDRLRDSKLKICLIEGGGLEPDRRSQELYRGEVVGHPYLPLHTCRFRMFGGSTNRWGGWCRPFDAHEFEARDWVPWSAWPIGDGDLRPFYQDTTKLFQLASGDFELDAWTGRLPPPFPLAGTAFENTVFPYSHPHTNFGLAYRERIAAAPDVTTLLHANVTDLRLDPGTSRVSVVRARTLTGREVAVRGRAVVLATGGIENARLLLCARHDRPAGLGNEHDLVGRFFMEHLHVPAGHIVPRGATCSRAFYQKAVYGDTKTRGVITPTAEAQRRHRLLTCSIAVEPQRYWFGTPFLGWPTPLTIGPMRAYARLPPGPGRALGDLAKSAGEIAWNQLCSLSTAWAARLARARAASEGVQAGELHSLYFRTEQAPDPASRVTLGRRRDELGLPQSRLDWRVGKFDTESIEGWLGLLDATLRANDVGRVIMPSEGWEKGIIGGPHHMGTTRMAHDPRHGVVDAACRVHSVENLYVAGSSVFATGGYTNPTFALVALALRLAERLRETLA